MNANRLVAGSAGRLYFYAYDATTSLPYSGLVYSGTYSPKNSQQRVSGVWQSGNTLGSLTDGVNDLASISAGKFIKHTGADPFGNLYSIDVASSYISNSGGVDAVRLQLGVSGINIVPYIHPITAGETSGAPIVNDTGAIATGIKAKTDQLVFNSGQILASINSVTYSGFDDIFQTYQLIESYPATGTAPTPGQSIILSQQAFTEFAISGSNIYVKKLDGTTNAAIYAMNPSSTSRIRSS
jgi:hypothetical protein